MLGLPPNFHDKTNKSLRELIPSVWCPVSQSSRATKWAVKVPTMSRGPCHSTYRGAITPFTSRGSLILSHMCIVFQRSILFGACPCLAACPYSCMLNSSVGYPQGRPRTGSFFTPFVTGVTCGPRPLLTTVFFGPLKDVYLHFKQEL